MLTQKYICLLQFPPSSRLYPKFPLPLKPLFSLFQNPNSQFNVKMSLTLPAVTQSDTNIGGIESDPKPQLTKIEDVDKKALSKRLKDVEIYVPIVYGTIAFWLGRKATETQSHKWTVYVRGATNEDLSGVIKKVVFQLHPSFNNPVRVVESPPYELSECGWGEFEIGISLFFHDDAGEKKLDLLHHLKLYAENEPGPQSTKKPVVVETYDEVVFPDPPEDFFSRIQSHPAVVVPRLPATIKLPPAPVEGLHELKRGDTKNHPLSQWFINFSEADELLKLTAARQRVQAHIVKLRRQLSVMDELPQTFKLDSD